MGSASEHTGPTQALLHTTGVKSLVSGGGSTGHGYRSQLHVRGAEAVGQEGTGLACTM